MCELSGSDTAPLIVRPRELAADCPRPRAFRELGEPVGLGRHTCLPPPGAIGVMSGCVDMKLRRLSTSFSAQSISFVVTVSHHPVPQLPELARGVSLHFSTRCPTTALNRPQDPGKLTFFRRRPEYVLNRAITSTLDRHGHRRRHFASCVLLLLLLLYTLAALLAQTRSPEDHAAVAAINAVLFPGGRLSGAAMGDTRAVLDWLSAQVVGSTWSERQCGDGSCDSPEEFPAWGRFGCKADCGVEESLAEVVVRVTYDFTDLIALGMLPLMQRCACARRRGEICSMHGGYLTAVTA